MTALMIHRLGADVPADVVQASPARVDRLLRLVADRALEKRHATYGALSGEWCVRRLDLELDLPADETDSTAADRWAALIAESIRDLVPDGNNVVHFRSRSRLLLDLVVGLTAGDLSRAWAWSQAGLLTSGDPDPADRPGAALVATVGREPRLAVPVLVAAAQQVGVRPLHALLGPAHWSGLADLVRPGWRDGASAVATARIARPGLEHRAAAVLSGSALARVIRSEGIVPDGVTRSAWAVLVLAESDPAGRADLLPWITAGLAHPVARQPARREYEPTAKPVAAKLDPPPSSIPRTGDPGPTRPHLTREPSAATDPDLDSDGSSSPSEASPRTGEPPPHSQPARPHLPATTAPARPGEPAARSARSTALPRTGEPPPHSQPVRPHLPAPTAPARPGEPAARSSTSTALPSAASTANPRAEVGTASPDADPELGVPTNWAGLLFLLNATAAADLPDAVEADVRLAGRPLRWVLHQLALRLVPIRADDPAALALAGLTPTMPVPAGPPAEPVEEVALEQHAAEWATAVGRLLAQARHPDDDIPIPTLWLVARRPGWIVADPGWLEVRLNLDDVDLLVRRAGLDLDPGWLGWLGTVVIFRYV